MLSKKTKYAISALVYLAKHLNEQPISVSKIAAEQNIPLKFLEVILVELRNAQIISSKKGKMGGYTLKEAPQEIDLARIIRLF
ncbi:MAG TPA: Rrf2 family transcriptional regulator, partial [Chitinophagales bacterium]|nr:Rrf2 family transcriptional regulator [Chitinophagales bacterium]